MLLTSTSRSAGWARLALPILLIVAMLATLGFASPQPVQAKPDTLAIPTFTIVSVEAGVSVKVQTANFPAGQVFTVRMGEYGTLAIGGTVIGTIDSGSGGAFQATFNIPDGLKDDTRVAIRMDSPQGYYAYNWFYNVPATTTTPVPVTGYTGIPTFSITSVVADSKVGVATNNFPPNQTFTIRMGEYGTLGVGGIVVGTLDSGTGGAFAAEFSIPAALAGRARIAIRMDSPQGYYAYNWFYNSSTGVSPTPGTTPVPVTGYTGFPSFSIKSVLGGDWVEIQTTNFPPSQTFTVRMGEYGTLGVGGAVVGTIDTGAGGAFTAKFDIPEGLLTRDRIAIRMDSPQGYYAYNWFWNSDANVATTPVPGVTPVPVTGYTGFPTFSIQSVVKDVSVTVRTNNLPPNITFTVKMNTYGTAGVGGTVVGTFESGTGGVKDLTFNIPDGLKGLSQIAVRIESAPGYYAYNWFWNSTYP